MTLDQAFDSVAKEFPKDLQAVAPRHRDRWPRLVAKAREVVAGPRQDDYGPPEINFKRIAKRWSGRMGRNITMSQVAWLMFDVKLARLGQTPDHEDSLIDAAGYAALATYLSHVDANP